MALRERLEADLKQAMKGGDAIRRETIRGVRGAVRNREIELGGTLDDEGILRVIRALVKQRAEAIEQYRAGGREDLVREVIAEVGAAGPRDVGRVMRPALERLGPAVDGKLVNETARRLLA